MPDKTKKKFTNYIINTKEWQGSPKRSKAYKLLGYLITDTIYIYKIQKMQMKKEKQQKYTDLYTNVTMLYCKLKVIVIS